MFISIVGGGILVVPFGVEAQQGVKVPVVGILNSGLGQSKSVEAVRRGLRDLGWVEGQTIVFDVHFAGLKLEAFPGLVADLLRRKVEVIFVSGPAGIRAAAAATRTIPIVALDLESAPWRRGSSAVLPSRGATLQGASSIIRR